ncbi:MAG: cytochrome c biogenesis protein CcdA [Dehalococcoidia bacterium]
MTSVAPATPRGNFLRQGYPRSLAIGAAFSVAWSPCIGPILGVVLTLAATSGNAFQGAVLLLAYALGLGVWFLAFGAFFSWLTPRLRRLQPVMGTLLAATGVLFMLVGALMFLGEFTRLNNYFQSFGFLFSQTATTEEQLAAEVSGVVGPAIAFLGGVLSFLSPCVLPLVPVYLASLAGEAFQPTGGSREDRRRVFRHSIAFVTGFTLVFVLVGASAGLVGGVVQDQIPILTRIGGVIMMVLGLHLSGLVRIPILERTYQASWS